MQSRRMLINRAAGSLLAMAAMSGAVARAENPALPIAEVPALPSAPAEQRNVAPIVDMPLPDAVSLADLLQEPETTGALVDLPVPPPVSPMVALPAPLPSADALVAKPKSEPLTPDAPRAELPPEALKAALAALKPKAGRLSARDIGDLQAFYAARDHQPFFLTGGEWSAAAKIARKVLETADAYGLDPQQYRTVAAFLPTEAPHWPALAAAELQMAEAVIAYAADASGGQIDPGRVHPLITPARPFVRAGDALARIREAADRSPEEVQGALQGFHPPHAAFHRLRDALAAARAARPAPIVSEALPDGPTLRMGMRDPRVPLIRAKLGLGTDGSAIYDRSLAIRVAGLQREAGLPVTGVFTPQTRRVLSGEGPSREEAEIIANMERWRWLPRDLGREHIIVNITELEMRLVRDAETRLAARIIIGKEDTQTPIFSDEMDHIVVNPSWYVPPGILKREPRYLDPLWAEARGYEIRRNGENVTVRVPPGASNALGNVKFMFPNHHAVYLHDTPGRHLFNAGNRHLSNGCVRVENPFRLAAALFETTGWTEARFRRMVGGAEQHMRLPKKLPIHLVHFTLTVAEDGTLKRHADTYGHSARLRGLLGLP